MTLKEFERGLRQETYNRYREAARNAQNENDAQMYNHSADVWGRAFGIEPSSEQEPVAETRVAEEYSRYIPEFNQTPNYKEQNIYGNDSTYNPNSYAATPQTSPRSYQYQGRSFAPEYTIKDNYTPPAERTTPSQTGMYTPYDSTDREILMAYLSIADAVRNGNWEGGKQIARDYGIDFRRALSTVANGWEHSRDLSTDLGSGIEAFRSKYDSILNPKDPPKNPPKDEQVFERDPYLDAVNKSLLTGEISQVEYEKLLRERQEESDAKGDVANIIAARTPQAPANKPKDDSISQEIKLSGQDAKAIELANALSNGRISRDEYNKALGISYPQAKQENKVNLFDPNVEYKASLDNSSDNKNGIYGYTPTGEYAKWLSGQSPVATFNKEKAKEFIAKKAAEKNKAKPSPTPQNSQEKPVSSTSNGKKAQTSLKPKEEPMVYNDFDKYVNGLNYAVQGGTITPEEYEELYRTRNNYIDETGLDAGKAIREVINRKARAKSEETKEEENKEKGLSETLPSKIDGVADFKRMQDTEVPTTYVGYHRNFGDNFPERADQEIRFIYGTGTSQDSPNISNQMTHGEWSARMASAKQRGLNDYKTSAYSYGDDNIPDETTVNNVRFAHNRHNDESWGNNQCTIYARALAKSSNLKNWNEVKNDTVDTYLNMKDKGLILAEYVNTKGDKPEQDNQQELRDIATDVPGLIVFWNPFDKDFERTDDPEDNDSSHALRGITHVGVTLGNGLVAQSGGGGIRSIPVGMYRIEALGDLSGEAGKLPTPKGRDLGTLYSPQKNKSAQASVSAKTDTSTNERLLSPAQYGLGALGLGALGTYLAQRNINKYFER